MTWKHDEELLFIVVDKILLGDSIADLASELKNNTWYISRNSIDLTDSDLMDFLSCVIDNRKKQLQEIAATHGMHFYVWYDRQASQLRFSLISDLHDKLPFACKVNQSSLNQIVNDFLMSPNLISYSELEITGITQKMMQETDDDIEYILNVYQLHLSVD